jgi:hypothetical protein
MYIGVLEVQMKLFSMLKIVDVVTRKLPLLLVNLVAWLWSLCSICYCSMAFFYLMPSTYNIYFAAMSWSFHVLIPLLALVSILLPKVKTGRTP